MDKVVNLNRFRKTRQRAQDAARAAENRVRHGRTRAERQQDADAEARRERLLDGSRVPESESEAGNGGQSGAPAKE